MGMSSRTCPEIAGELWHARARMSESYRPQVERAIRFIVERLDRPLTVREVARVAHLSEARVVFAARTLEVLTREAAAVVRAGGEALAVELDVTSDASVEAAIAASLRRFGRVDVVVNNAGNGGTMSLWADTPASAARDTFDVHLLGAERVMRAVLPAMRAQGGGTIVNVASTLGWVPMPGAALYSAAKAAVVAFSQVARAELASEGIDVRVFAPPHTSTAAGERMPLDLPKIFAPEWVAEQFVRFLRGRRACALPGGNGALLLVQRASPALAARIMNRIGFDALAKSAGLTERPSR